MQRLLTAAGAIAALMVTAAPAHAEYWFTTHGAGIATRDAVYKKYSYNRYTLGYYCHPQGARRPLPGYKYHRWVCTWYTSNTDSCLSAKGTYGQLLIVGHSGVGRYGYEVLHGATCDDT